MIISGNYSSKKEVSKQKKNAENVVRFHPGQEKKRNNYFHRKKKPQRKCVTEQSYLCVYPNGCKEDSYKGMEMIDSEQYRVVNSPMSNDCFTNGSSISTASVSSSSSQCSQNNDVSRFISPEVCKHEIETFLHHPEKETKQTILASLIMSPDKEISRKHENQKNVEELNSIVNSQASLGLKSLKKVFTPPRYDFSAFSTPVEIKVYYLEAKYHPHRINGIPWKHMNREWYRLMSFVKFPIDSSVSTIRLASKGFAYLNKESDHMIICFFCGCQLKMCNDVDSIDEEHERLGLDCPMVKGTHSSNISIERQFPDRNADVIFSKLLASRQDEAQIKQPHTSGAAPLSQDNNSETKFSQASDESAPYAVVTNFSDLAESDSNIKNSGPSGQSSQMQEDSVSTQIQGGAASQSSSVPQASISEDNGSVKSSSAVENSSAQQNNSQQEQPKDPKDNADANAGEATSYEKLGIITARPKRVEYAVYATRFNSFNEWPKDHHMKPTDLAKAGYFYTGYSDCARCFYCGGGLRNWEHQDDVWVEHARWFPKCAFLLQEVGKDFIETVQAISKERDEIKYDDVIRRMQGSDAPTPLKCKEMIYERDPAVLSVVDNGFDKDQITKLAQQIRKSGELISAEKLYVAAKERKIPMKDCSNNLGSDSVSIRKGGNEKRDKETIETLRNENNELRQQTLCKICMDMEVAVVFLPCGHLVSCTECSCALTACPVCRFGIKGIVRAYIG